LKIKASKVLTQAGFLENREVTVEDGVIREIAPCSAACADAFILAYGYFDTHTHGSAGFDTLNPGEEALARYLLIQASHGVTDVLLTTSCASKENLKNSVRFIRNAMKKQKAGSLKGAVIRGIHLEGPFLNPKRLGTMVEEHITSPSLDTLFELADGTLDDIRIITIAPEMPGAELLSRALQKHGVCVQMGHSDASYEEAENAFKNGFSSLCHTFNACRPIHHRAPGPIAFALTEKSMYAEVICDFQHLHPGTVKLIGRLKLPDRLCLISDSVKGLDMPDGTYVDSLGKTTVVKGGVIRSDAGSLDGGTCYLDASVKNLFSLIHDYESAVACANRVPAERIGFHRQLGTVDTGKEANLIFLDESLNVQKTIIGGNVFG